MKLCCAILLRLGLKGVKIFWNVMKVHVYACLSDGHSNLWSNFNSKKSLKSETLSSDSLGLSLKKVKIAQNVAKVGVHAFLSSGHPNLWSSLNSEKLVKSKTPSFSFVKDLLKGGENSSEHHEIRHALVLPNGHLNLRSNFNSEKLVKSLLRHALSQRLHLKGVKTTSLRLFLHQPWITTKIDSNILIVGVQSYLPNAQINLWSNFNSEKLVESETLLCGFVKIENRTA